MSGWIKIHRCINNHWIYTEKRSFSKFEAWIDILMTVNFADAQVLIKGKLYQVKRGQSILSMDSWAKRWNWDKSKVRRFFELLQKDSMIVIKTDTITTQLTVCNYDSYQDERHTDKPQTKRTQNANETHTTPIKEEEEEQEEQEDKKDIERQFENVWSMYRRKGNKQTALTAFIRLTKKHKLEIEKHIPIFIQNHVDNDKLEYLPHFSSYINQKRWEDDLPYKQKEVNTFVMRNLANLNDD